MYEAIFARCLEKQGLRVQRQRPIRIEYDGMTFDEGFSADLLLNEKVVIELKSVEKIHPAHKKQLFTYLKLTGCKLGYLLNFGEELMKNGITRVIHGGLNPQWKISFPGHSPCLCASVRNLLSMGVKSWEKTMCFAWGIARFDVAVQGRLTWGSCND